VAGPHLSAMEVWKVRLSTAYDRLRRTGQSRRRGQAAESRKAGPSDTGRPHMSLGPGIPQSTPHLPAPRQAHRHRLPAHLRVVARPILGGLHHEYRLEAKVA
jgi:hypothetical protein